MPQYVLLILVFFIIAAIITLSVHMAAESRRITHRCLAKIVKASKRNNADEQIALVNEAIMFLRKHSYSASIKRKRRHRIKQWYLQLHDIRRELIAIRENTSTSAKHEMRAKLRDFLEEYDIRSFHVLLAKNYYVLMSICCIVGVLAAIFHPGLTVY